MGERPLVTVTLALLTGLFLSNVFFYFPLCLSVLLLSFLFVDVFIFQGRLLPSGVYWVGLAGFLVYQVVSTPFSQEDLSRYRNQGPIHLLAEVSAPIRHSPNHVSLQMEGIKLFLASSASSVNGRFQLNIYNREVPFEYGDRLEMMIRLRSSGQFQNQGAFQFGDYRERTGWSGFASLPHFDQIHKVGEGGIPLLKRIYRWRDTVRLRILSSMEGPAVGLLMAIIIGETGYLSDEVRDVFSRSGTAHLLAVSGTHLAFISLLLFGLSRSLLLCLPARLLLRLSLWKIASQLAALITAFGVTFYTFFSGGRIGTLRALTMILVYLASIWFSRQRDAQCSLSLAALIILIFNPRALFEISFQFSFLAVLSIILLVEWWAEIGPKYFLEKEVPFARRVFIDGPRLMFISTMGATLGTAPLSLYYFHQFSWVGPVANMVLLPLAGWVMIPLGLFSAIGSLFMEKGFFLSGVNQHLWSFYLDATRFFSAFPGAGFHFSSPHFLLVFLFYACFFFVIVKKKSFRWLLAVNAVFFLTFLGWGGFRVFPDRPRVTFMDVGQGDAVLVEFPHGETMLIDGGDRRAGMFSVAPSLWEARIRKIDYLVGSHPQADHIGGFPYLVRNFEIGEAWINGKDIDTQTYRTLTESLNKKHIPIKTITRESSSVEIHPCGLQFLHPTQDKNLKFKEMNDQSIVIKMTCSGEKGSVVSFLFSGDLEKAGEKILLSRSDHLKSSILKVPHHGSQSASGRPFVTSVSPEIAIISVGRQNRHHHPHASVLDLYAESGSRVYRTDQEGAIVVEMKEPMKKNDPGFIISSFSDRKVKKVRWSSSLLLEEWKNIRKVFLF
ncbi:MAG: DNA internalization-related competence protein ComEC/Rec2 [Nitrospiria bacterium]